MIIKTKFRDIYKGGKPYFIADIGANHDGDLGRALRLIELAKEAGADAAKFQNFAADKIVSKEGFEALGGQISHQKNWKKGVFEIYRDASISQDWTAILKAKCDEVEIDYFTSPYDFDAVDHVNPFVDMFKIGSGDITWLEIIKYIKDKNKPVMLATGASNLEEVKLAMSVLEGHSNGLVLMQCNTNYTLDADKFRFCNLSVLNEYSALFPEVILGLSDHTISDSTVLASIALGATVIEKHFTDDNDREGPDHKFAIAPKQWRLMVSRGNEVYEALGDGIKRVEENEKMSQVVQRRCLRAKKNLMSGQIIQEVDLEALRPIPDEGVPPYLLDEFIGKELKRDLLVGEHITFAHI